MRWLLVACVHAYRAVAAYIGFRRTCLFDVSCSWHVEEALRRRGAVAGALAAWRRWRVCRPGYRFEYDAVGWSMVLVDGTSVLAEDVSPALGAEAALLASYAMP